MSELGARELQIYLALNESADALHYMAGIQQGLMTFVDSFFDCPVLSTETAITVVGFAERSTVHGRLSGGSAPNEWPSLSTKGPPPYAQLFSTLERLIDIDSSSFDGAVFEPVLTVVQAAEPWPADDWSPAFDALAASGGLSSLFVAGPEPPHGSIARHASGLGLTTVVADLPDWPDHLLRLLREHGDSSPRGNAPDKADGHPQRFHPTDLDLDWI